MYRKERRNKNVSVDFKTQPMPSRNPQNIRKKSNISYVSQHQQMNEETQKYKKEQEQYRKITALPKLGPTKVKADELIDKFT
jgi:hypothetical protein